MTAIELEELAREIAAACDSEGAVPSSGQSSAHSFVETREQVAAMIDQTLLRPDATEADLRSFLAAARLARFHAVCVQPTWVSLAVREMRGRSTKVASVVGFPHGATVTSVKCVEAETAIRLGAGEIDLVANIGALRSDDLDAVFTDIKAVAAVTSRSSAALKVILEMPRLNARQKINACVIAKLAGADLVKTSTGFEGSNATVADVETMHRVLGGVLGIKAAGGIRSYSELLDMHQAGATRIGTSSGLEILSEIRTA